MGTPVGIVLVLLGLVLAAFPYPVARLDVRTGAVGSGRRRSGVGPTEVRVFRTRIAGVAVCLFGQIAIFA